MFMNKENRQPPANRSIDDFLNRTSSVTKLLFDYFTDEFRKAGPVTLHPAKTMIGIATPRKRIAYITRFGKNFIHVVFPFEEAYPDNLCFQKIAQVPGEKKQFNHHFRMYRKEDVNNEVRKFMKLAYRLGS